MISHHISGLIDVVKLEKTSLWRNKTLSGLYSALAACQMMERENTNNTTQTGLESPANGQKSYVLNDRTNVFNKDCICLAGTRDSSCPIHRQ